MKRRKWNEDWLFLLKSDIDHLDFMGHGAREPQPVHLPHDWSIEKDRHPDAPGGVGNGFFPGGVGEYTKRLYVPDEWEHRTVMLEFEGVYMDAEVSVNGNLVCRHPYGYTSFHVDLTPYLQIGAENVIKVTVHNNAQPNSRWYSGSGIYRHVWLLVAESVHIHPWGVYVTTPRANAEHSHIHIRTTIANRSGRRTTVRVSSAIFSPEGLEVARSEVPITLLPGVDAEAIQRVDVAPASLWSLDNPALYRVESKLIHGDRVVDDAETVFGIREISFDSRNGFMLNRETIKLRGANIHHDHGPIGARSFDRAEERKVEILKEAGFNAIRSAHNPPSPALLSACDRIGMLVMNETFDSWRSKKTIHDYHHHFEAWWERDTRATVVRDRNHPSVILWSIGNEVAERNGSSDGNLWARRQAELVRQLDPTRPVTSGINGIEPGAEVVEGILGNLIQQDADGSSERENAPDLNDFVLAYAHNDQWGSLTEEYAAALDVVCYNYLHNRYEADGAAYPHRVICGSESFPKHTARDWEKVMRFNHVIGDFAWTGWDYIGESGLGRVRYDGNKEILGTYPWHIANCGDIDICGFRKPQSYYREIVWGLREEPYIVTQHPQHFGREVTTTVWGWPDVHHRWSWEGFENKPCKVTVYAKADEVELQLNGKVIDRKRCGESYPFEVDFELPYEPGELLAITYIDGIEQARNQLVTPGKAHRLQLDTDRAIIAEEYGSLAYVTCNVVDEAGSKVAAGAFEIRVDVTGAGQLIGLGTGDPISEEKYTGPFRSSYNGSLLAIVSSNGAPGEISIFAQAEGLQPAHARIKILST